jgi:hypothetical protein
MHLMMVEAAASWSLAGWNGMADELSRLSIARKMAGNHRSVFPPNLLPSSIKQTPL